MLMEINRQMLFGLMDRYCDGNYNRFAKELEIDPSHLYRFLNKGVGGGKKLVGAVIKFCRERELNFEEYIEI